MERERLRFFAGEGAPKFLLGEGERGIYFKSYRALREADKGRNYGDWTRHVGCIEALAAYKGGR